MPEDLKNLYNDNHHSENREMFNAIAHKYDFLNHFLSFGIDRSWRRKAVKSFSNIESALIAIDLCAGTADLALELFKRKKFKGKIILIDAAMQMLIIARNKLDKNMLGKRTVLLESDANNIPVKESTVDSAMVAFGIRNLNNPEAGIRSVYRSLKRDGEFVILEFSTPRNRLFALIFRIYFLRILPRIGRLISKSEFAYSYLPESVGLFTERVDLTAVMKKVGFKDVKCRPLTGGIAEIYFGRK